MRPRARDYRNFYPGCCNDILSGEIYRIKRTWCKGLRSFDFVVLNVIVYLQMVGSRNKEKERKINQLLEGDRKKVLEMAIPDPDEELPFHLLYVLKKIKIWFSSRCRDIEIYNLW